MWIINDKRSLGRLQGLKHKFIPLGQCEGSGSDCRGSGGRLQGFALINKW